MPVRFLLTVVLLAMAGFSTAQAETVQNALQIYDQTTNTVTKNFYDPTFRGLPWPTLVKQYRAKVSNNIEKSDLVKIVNELLKHLHASHTEFLSNDEQEYWALQSIFSGGLNGDPIPNIGAWFKRHQGRWFIQYLPDDSPAQKAGLLQGDEVVSVNGHPLEPVRSFTDSPAGVVKVAIRHTAGSRIQTYLVKPVTESFSSVFYKATAKSMRTYKMRGKKIGYFHLWSGTNDKFKVALQAAATKFEKSSDVMLLDLRDGFGGADPSYLNPFFNRDENGSPIRPVFTKPLVVLINGEIRSGKEWITYLLKLHKRGVLVGTQTAGYFLSGRLFDIERGQFDLYLAVAKGPPGVNLEGHGVKPDIAVPMNIPYLDGYDPQLKAALKIAANLAKL